MRFPLLPGPIGRGDAANLSWSHHSVWMFLVPRLQSHAIAGASLLSGHALARAFFFLWSQAVACILVFFFWSGAARARSFCTRQRSRLTNIAIFNTSFFQIDGSCSSPGVAGCSTARQALRHLRTGRHRGSPRPDGARQVRLACAKPQTSREVDQDPEGGLTRHCNARPSFLILCCVPQEQRQHENHYHKTTTAGTFHNVYEVDGIKGDAEHEVAELENAHEEGKPCVICQDTIWSTHDLSGHVSRCLFLSHTPSQDQQITADEGTFHYVTYTALLQ